MFNFLFFNSEYITNGYNIMVDHWSKSDKTVRAKVIDVSKKEKRFCVTLVILFKNRSKSLLKILIETKKHKLWFAQSLHVSRLINMTNKWSNVFKII